MTERIVLAREKIIGLGFIAPPVARALPLGWLFLFLFFFFYLKKETVMMNGESLICSVCVGRRIIEIVGEIIIDRGKGTSVQ